jgi:hypothetical protein
MTVKLTRGADPRFHLHKVQPRGKRLDKRQRELCATDHMFKQALRVRVSSAARWDAFLAGASYYIGNPCKRCHSTHRRVYDSSCFDCQLARNKQDFALIRKGIHPPANRSREGWLDRHERMRKERAGDCLRYECGQYVAEQFPTGRVRLIAPHLHINTPDLKRDMPAARVYSLALSDPDFLTLLRRLGWA